MDHLEDLGDPEALEGLEVPEVLEAKEVKAPQEVPEDHLEHPARKDRAALECLPAHQGQEELVVHRQPNFSDLRASRAQLLVLLRRHQRQAKVQLHSKTWVFPRASRRGSV